MKVRIKLTKNDSIKYLGHLDVMRAFQKALNRAGVLMTYSEGFNPHQKLSFALPLGVGITSRAEYLDAEIRDGQNLETIKNNLNSASGSDFEILEIKELNEPHKKAMAAVEYSKYRISYNDIEIKEKNISDFLSSESIFLYKKTKSQEKETDIRPLIFEFSLNNDSSLTAVVKAGCVNNLKPESLIIAFCDFAGIEYKRDSYSYEREELMGESFVPLIDIDTL